ncbi:EF-hand_domain [Hexamita inflata]|uniref:EF-hand_domain n=1 Tax=Hexamita inflata TaxID=28002 RepID=A0ABP1HQ58_9EUKA
MFTNRNKTVDPFEIHWELRRHFENIPQKVSMTMVKLLDTNGDGSIDKQEFANFMQIMDVIKQDSDIYKLIFKALDRDKTGEIFCSELKEVLLKLNIIENLGSFGVTIKEHEFQKLLLPYTGQLLGTESLPFVEFDSKEPDNIVILGNNNSSGNILRKTNVKSQ